MRNRVLLRLYRLFFQKNKIAVVLAVAGIGVLGVLTAAHAGFTDGIADIVGTLISSLAQLVIELVGKLFVVLIDILLAVVQYNDFINAPAVVKAWVLIRDFANMAFLIIFIAIAFATILGVEKYEYKQLLPKLLFMAVAINFSRTLCGIVLDAAQVVMMTFVNGFKDVAAGNLIRGFGLTDLLTLNSTASATGGRGVDNTSLAIASVLAVVILVVSAIVVGVIVFMFLIRVIYLWILIILSPLAFLMAATPGMSGKFSEWWGQFVKYAMVGPILAFFLWLSFSIMASVKPTENLAQSSGFGGITDSAQNVSAAITTISSSGNLLSFAIAIALLVMSLSVAQSLGVKGGQIAGAALSKIQSGGVKLAKLGALGVATGGLGAVAGYLGYRGAKKFAGTGLGKMYIEDKDRKYGRSIVRAGATIASKIPFVPKITKQRLQAFKEEPTRLGKFKESWMDLRKLEREEGTAIGEAKTKDAYMKSVHGIQTDYAGQVMSGLIEKRAKEHAEISMDEDSIVSRWAQAEKDLENAKNSGASPQSLRKATIDLLALEKLIFRNNAQNGALGKQFAEGKVTPDLIKAMGEVDKKPENLADYLETFHSDEYKDGELTNRFNEIQKVEDQEEKKKQMAAFSTDLRKKFEATTEGAGKTDEQMKSMVGNRLYAKKYRVLDAAKESQWKGKRLEVRDGQTYIVDDEAGTEINENELLANDVLAGGHGVEIDKDTMAISDKGAYAGTADVLHWQQWQEKMHKGMDLSKILGLDNFERKFERDLGLDAIKANNLSFGFTVKEMTVDVEDPKTGKMVKKQVLEKIDTSSVADLKLHDNLFGGKLATGSVGDAAKQHPMTMNQQSFAGGKMFISTKAPSWGDQMMQATAAGDPRAWSSERVDSQLALINLKREDLHYPLSDEDKKNYARLYYVLHNPINGIVDRMPSAPFTVRGSKLLQTLNIEEISNPGNVRDYYENNGMSLGGKPSKPAGGTGGGAAGAAPTIIVKESVGSGPRSEEDNKEMQQAKREAQQGRGGNTPT